MSTYSMKNQPSISVQLTATSAMGILKHWAIYRSSTSKALWQAREKSAAVVQQLHYNGSSVLLLLKTDTAVHSLGIKAENMVQNCPYFHSFFLNSRTKQMYILSTVLEKILIVVLNLMLWAHISHGMQPLQSKQPWLNSIKASVLPDDTSGGLCGCDWSYFYCYCYSC